jgi:hypothetical protein
MKSVEQPRHSSTDGTDKLAAVGDNRRMNRSASLYKRHRFPPEIIQNAVWLYHRFHPSARDGTYRLTAAE